MAIIRQEGNLLTMRRDAEYLWIEPWGKNSLRVRAVRGLGAPDENWALLPQQDPGEAVIEVCDDEGSITNGKLTAKEARLILRFSAKLESAI